MKCHLKEILLSVFLFLPITLCAEDKEPPFSLGVDLQTKYVWRGMEMMTDKAAPVVFPGINYQHRNVSAYILGGYSFNGEYAELDFGLSYTWKSVSLSVNDYYYPSVNSANDNYLDYGKNTGHWLEAAVNFSPSALPLWVNFSNFFYGADKYFDTEGNLKQAFSSYVELGTYHDFLSKSRISLAIGVALNKSCYNAYDKGVSVCNIEMKYTYNAEISSTLSIPLSTSIIYNPVFNKSFVNFSTGISF